MALFGSRYNCSALGIVTTLTTNYGVKQSQFANRLHLVLHACEILFSENVRASFIAKPNKANSDDDVAANMDNDVAAYMDDDVVAYVAAYMALMMARAGALSSSRCFVSRTSFSLSQDDETLGGNGGQACDDVDVVL